MSAWALLVVASSLATDGPRPAHAVELVLDADPRMGQPFITAGECAGLGEDVICALATEAWGLEPWRIRPDGRADLVRDLAPGEGGSAPNHFRPWGGGLLFLGVDPGMEVEQQLYWTDGTRANTRLQAPERRGWKVGGFVVMEKGVLVAGEDSALGRELWLLDAERRWSLVKDIAPGAASAGVGLLHATDSGARAYFVAEAKEGEGGLWITDGTTQGTRAVLEVMGQAMRNDYTARSAADGSAVLGEVLVFFGERGLWRSDGTPQGTYRLQELPGAGSSWARLGDRVYSIAGPHHDKGIWFTDGSKAGTGRLRWKSTGYMREQPQGLVASGDRLFFTVGDGHGSAQGLLVSNGSPEGTRRVLAGDGATAPPAIVQGVSSYGQTPMDESQRRAVTASRFRGIVPVTGEGVVFLGARPVDPISGPKPPALIRHDGTAERGVAPLPRTGGPPGFIQDLHQAGRHVLIVQRDGHRQPRLHLWSGGEAPPLEVRAVQSVGRSGLPADAHQPHFLPHPEGVYVFSFARQADEGVLWSKLGRARATPIAGPGMKSMSGVTLGARLVFSTGGVLWHSDGTAAGTRPWPYGRDAAHFVRLRGRVYFHAAATTPGRRVPSTWTSDGTPAGTREVQDVLPLPYLSREAREEWALVQVPRPGPSHPTWFDTGTFETHALEGLGEGAVRGPFRWAGADYVAVNHPPARPPIDSPHLTSVYRLSPDRLRATPVTTVECTYDGASQFVAAGDFLYFQCRGKGRPGLSTLWSMDRETLRPMELLPYRLQPRLQPRAPHPVGDRVLFFASDDESGVELWVSEGRPERTRRLLDLAPGARSGLRRGPPVVAMGVLYFAATDGDGPVRLWRSDGTAEGTWAVPLQGPAELPTDPAALRVEGEDLYFTAFTPGTGRELWRMRLMPGPWGEKSR